MKENGGRAGSQIGVIGLGVKEGGGCIEGPAKGQG